MWYKPHKNVWVQWHCVCVYTCACNLALRNHVSTMWGLSIGGFSIVLSQSLSSISSHVLVCDTFPTSHSSLIKACIFGLFLSVSYSFLEYALYYWACFCYTWWLGCREYGDKGVWQCGHRVRMCTPAIIPIHLHITAWILYPYLCYAN
jgi:hypothetical protein